MADFEPAADSVAYAEAAAWAASGVVALVSRQVLPVSFLQAWVAAVLPALSHCRRECLRELQTQACHQALVVRK